MGKSSRREPRGGSGVWHPTCPGTPHAVEGRVEASQASRVLDRERGDQAEDRRPHPCEDLISRLCKTGYAPVWLLLVLGCVLITEAPQESPAPLSRGC